MIQTPVPSREERRSRGFRSRSGGVAETQDLLRSVECRGPREHDVRNLMRRSPGERGSVRGSVEESTDRELPPWKGRIRVADRRTDARAEGRAVARSHRDVSRWPTPRGPIAAGAPRGDRSPNPIQSDRPLTATGVLAASAVGAGGISV
jgi:hypothetical protein